MKSLKFICLFMLAAIISLPVFSQGVVVHKKDGTRVVFPYETIDSIVTYNYNEEPPASEDIDFDGKDQTFTVNGVSFKMIAVQGGTFTMGATSEQGSDAEDNEKPAHSVTLSSYYIGKTEVTQELWQAVMDSNPSKFKGDRKPVEQVSWNDCQTFISKLNSLTGKNFRLPT